MSLTEFSYSNGAVINHTTGAGPSFSPASGDGAVVFIGMRVAAGGTAPTVSTVTDSKGNTWHSFGAGGAVTSPAGVTRWELWYATGLAAGVTNVTIKPTADCTLLVDGVIVPGMTAIDKVALHADGGTTLTVASGSTGTLSASGEVCIGFAAWQNGGSQTLTSPTSGFTMGTQHSSNVSSQALTGQLGYTATLSGTTAQSFGGTLSGTNTPPWTAYCVTVQFSAGTPVTQIAVFAGCMDRNGGAVQGYTPPVTGGYGVANINWKDIVDSSNTLLATNAIDHAITAAGGVAAASTGLKIRLFCGYQSPAWLMNQVGTYQEIETQSGNPYTVPKFWATAYVNAYTSLISQIAARYDGKIADITIAGSMTVYAEPCLLGFGTAQTVTNALAAGYTEAARLAAFQSAIRAHSVFTQTSSSLACNPANTIDDTTHRVTTGNWTYTKTNVIDYGVTQLGRMFVPGNNSVGNSNNYATNMYPYLAQLAANGQRIYFQTASIAQMTSAWTLLSVLQWCDQQGAYYVELPSGYQNNVQAGTATTPNTIAYFTHRMQVRAAAWPGNQGTGNPPPPPTHTLSVNAQLDSVPTAGQVVTGNCGTFTDSVSGTQASGYTGQFDFGDSSPVTSVTITGPDANGVFTCAIPASSTEAYANAGSYTIALTVTFVGTGDTGTDTTPITVNAVAPPPPPPPVAVPTSRRQSPVLGVIARPPTMTAPLDAVVARVQALETAPPAAMELVGHTDYGDSGSFSAAGPFGTAQEVPGARTNTFTLTRPAVVLCLAMLIPTVSAKTGGGAGYGYFRFNVWQGAVYSAQNVGQQSAVLSTLGYAPIMLYYSKQLPAGTYQASVDVMFDDPSQTSEVLNVSVDVFRMGG